MQRSRKRREENRRQRKEEKETKRITKFYDPGELRKRIAKSWWVTKIASVTREED
jgi:hypothetical protein